MDAQTIDVPPAASLVAKKGPRAANTYRGARRNEMRESGTLGDWRQTGAFAVRANIKAKRRFGSARINVPNWRCLPAIGLNGSRAVARRLRQIERGQLTAANGLVL